MTRETNLPPLERLLYPRHWTVRQGLMRCGALWAASAASLAWYLRAQDRGGPPWLELLTGLLLVWSLALPVYWVYDRLRAAVER